MNYILSVAIVSAIENYRQKNIQNLGYFLTFC